MGSEGGDGQGHENRRHRRQAKHVVEGKIYLWLKGRCARLHCALGPKSSTSNLLVFLSACVFLLKSLQLKTWRLTSDHRILCSLRFDG